MEKLSHFDEHGASRMVDVSSKEVTHRRAKASGRVQMQAGTARLIRDREHAKGDVLEVARLAGIQAAKRTCELIPLCHQIPLSEVTVDFSFDGDTTLCVSATAAAVARTGVEMEALTAVAVASLTVYDMCKAVDRAIAIGRITLDEKSGGRSGHYVRKADPSQEALD